MKSSDCDCGGVMRETNRIVNGADSNPNEIPWQIGVTRAGQRVPFCGGTLISSQYVMTAAHCIQNTKPSDIEVILGEHDITTTRDSAITMKVTNIIEHPNYDTGTVNNDFAILKLASPVDLKANRNIVQLACLPQPNYNAADGTVATISGWGTLETGGSERPRRLQKATVSMENQNSCIDTYKRVNPITEQMICAKGVGTDTCQGDSGGE